MKCLFAGFNTWTRANTRSIRNLPAIENRFGQRSTLKIKLARRMRPSQFYSVGLGVADVYCAVVPAMFESAELFVAV